MYQANAIDDAAKPGYSEEDGARTGVKIIGDANRPEGVEGKTDIIMPNKTNKISILISY